MLTYSKSQRISLPKISLQCIFKDVLDYNKIDLTKNSERIIS